MLSPSWKPSATRMSAHETRSKAHAHHKRTLAVREKLGFLRDYPLPKACTSPFAPIWINEMVKRKG